MIKKHLLSLIDIKLIIFLVVIIALCGILTLLFSDKVKDFATTHKKGFYIYLFSFVLIYAIVVFLGHNKLFNELSDEFLFYQIVSTLLGILHVWMYRWYFKEFDNRKVSIELLFATLVILYSSVIFAIIYTALNGIALTLLMSLHFVLFIVPTGIYMSFNYMMQIPPRKFITWNPEKSYKAIESHEMEDILLITLLIRKEESDEEYASIRAQAPLKVDFGRLFYLTIAGYNKYNMGDPIELYQPNNQSYNWVFYLQPKWYEKAKYVDAAYYVGLNGITENSVIICQREKEKNEKPKKHEKASQQVLTIDQLNEESKAEGIEEIEGSATDNKKIR